MGLLDAAQAANNEEARQVRDERNRQVKAGVAGLIDHFRARFGVELQYLDVVRDVAWRIYPAADRYGYVTGGHRVVSHDEYRFQVEPGVVFVTGTDKVGAVPAVTRGMYLELRCESCRGRALSKSCLPVWLSDKERERHTPETAPLVAHIAADLKQPALCPSCEKNIPKDCPSCGRSNR